MDAGRQMVEGLAGGIEESDAALEAMRKQMDGILDRARSAAPDLQATGDELARKLAEGLEGNGGAEGWFKRLQHWAEDAASGIEAALGVGYGAAQRDEMLGRSREVLLAKEAQLTQEIIAARATLNTLHKGSVDYLQVEQE